MVRAMITSILTACIESPKIYPTHPKGVDNGDRVKARAGAQSDTNYTFGSVGNGLYRAGDGSSTACTALKCVDGYVYALPLFRVHRRNQTAAANF